jgi:redox-sensitive bicupin YhaK (pirin superfamily)
MGNEHTLVRGQAQYMSAGTGVTHSEFNFGSEELRFMQMWILPDKKDYDPNYGDYPFVWEDRIGQWMPIAAGYDNTDSVAPIKIHADVSVYATLITAGESINVKVGANEQAYLVLLEGDATAENIEMSERDALEIIKQDVMIATEKGAHLYLIVMPFDALD